MVKKKNRQFKQKDRKRVEKKTEKLNTKVSSPITKDQGWHKMLGGYLKSKLLKFQLRREMDSN